MKGFIYLFIYFIQSMKAGKDLRKGTRRIMTKNTNKKTHLKDDLNM